jgi:hypothetical protein
MDAVGSARLGPPACLQSGVFRARWAGGRLRDFVRCAAVYSCGFTGLVQPSMRANGRGRGTAVERSAPRVAKAKRERLLEGFACFCVASCDFRMLLPSMLFCCSSSVILFCTGPPCRAAGVRSTRRSAPHRTAKRKLPTGAKAYAQTDQPSAAGPRQPVRVRT